MLTNDELAAALVLADDRVRHTGTGHSYFQGYTEHLSALLAEQLRRALQPTEGFHPAKTPMEGGFSLDKFMPGLLPEDAEAFGEALESADLSGTDLSKCPICGGLADNGIDRESPPNVYACSKCSAEITPSAALINEWSCPASPPSTALISKEVL